MANDRRREPRRARRLQVRFWRPGSDQRFYGFTTNLSNTGIFVAATSVQPVGQRLRLEVSSGDRSFVAEGIVARALRSHVSLQHVVGSGMGIRFLPVRELLTELLPQLGTAEDAAPVAADDGAFEVRFQTAAHFLDAYRRDISTGGLFVPTFQPAPLHAVITVRLHVLHPDLPPVAVKARVVQRYEPRGDGEGTANLLAGMGVELVDLAAARPQLEALASQLAGSATIGSPLSSS